jgi:hypothetical protein
MPNPGIILKESVSARVMLKNGRGTYSISDQDLTKHYGSTIGNNKITSCQSINPIFQLGTYFSSHLYAAKSINESSPLIADAKASPQLPDGGMSPPPIELWRSGNSEMFWTRLRTVGKPQK